MDCISCRERLGPGFPGAEVTCPHCGAAQRLPPAAQPPSETGGPYREAGRLDVAAEPVWPHDLGGGGPCPRCPGAFLEPRYEDFGCARCGGRFTPHERLLTLVEEHREAGARTPGPPAPPEAEVFYLPCPRCKERMERKNFGSSSGILIDVCKVHGVWLDRGELDAVLAHAASLPQAASAREALQALVHGARRPVPREAPRPPFEHDFGMFRERRTDDSVERAIGWLSRLLG